jgi:hypothetical protein
VDMTCRPSVPGYLVTEPVAGNFFPVNTAAVIRDNKAALSVLVDRAQASSALCPLPFPHFVHLESNPVCLHIGGACCMRLV